MVETFRPRNKPDRLRLGEDTYLLQKVDKAWKLSTHRGQNQRSELLRFDDPFFKDMKTFEYDKLPEKSIRLMRLNGGKLTDTLQCELIEAAYNNPFHIPTKVRPSMEACQPSDLGHHLETKAEEDLRVLKKHLEEEEKQFQEEEKARSEGKEEQLTGQETRSTNEGSNIIEEDNVSSHEGNNSTEGDDDSGAEESDSGEEDHDSKEEGNNLRKKRLKNIDRLRLEVQEKELEIVEEIEIEYEALSWCWGRDISDYAVIVRKGSENYKMRIRKDLALALTYLRHKERIRTLWIDAICINQENAVERNQQVQMMSRIYTRADNVCIWLGEQDDHSELAFKFIKEEITHLKDFDSISSDKDYSSKWQALMVLMQREWFSRRWVVQELSLANKAEIWCGPDSIPWKEFAVAVELFVEVESATHRLSEVMKKDEKFQHVPGWFEHVSELGASLLVQATGKVFRVYGTPMDENEDKNRRTDEAMTDQDKAKREKEERDAAKQKKHVQRTSSLKNIQTIDPLDRRSLLSLEFLVTTMFIFKASECRDSVYSMLAIARDAAPFAEPTSSTNDVSFRMSLFECFLAEKPFLVDYARPYSDVCRDFMEFCIQRKSSQDPVQALDILCRPWALDPPQGKSIRLKPNKSPDAEQKDSPPRLKQKRDRPWEKRICKVRVQQESETLKWSYEKQDTDAKILDKRNMKQYWEETETKSEWEDGNFRWKKPKGWKKVEALCKDPRRQKQENKTGKNSMDPVKDVPLPSWVPRAKNAPFEIYRHPGIQIKKTGRANADPLVGWPQDGHRNYSAAQTETVKLDCLKFKKRPSTGHYSLYVAGFKVDEVEEVKDASQGGSIPNSWLELSDWEPPYNKDPPADFWRTIVADRGFDNRNPPYYYARACRESVDKGGRESGSVNTTALINNERNSIIAEFCRRVQAVIWGRSLFKTKGGKLGLAKDVKAGDWVCVLHGCTVPVILSRRFKKPGKREAEDLEDQFEAFKSCFRRMENICVRQKRYEDQKKLHKKQEEDQRAAQEKRPGEQQEEQEHTQKESEERRQDQISKLEAFRRYVMTWFRAPTDNQASECQASECQAWECQASEWEQDVKRAQKIANEVLKLDREAREKQQTYDKERKELLKPEDNEDVEKGEAKPRFAQDKDTYYVFKGESYVHGCMDGEAVRNRFYGTEEEWIYELR
ncbi:heterokaryon incompatibility protein-domain-containing protein [Paraphoma chrysanthemicola]|uniref:Heterokaryon incompatibility protein-domain-containing protein n=1 Tax=Paraphoma chrysanthemicola TaxID=798071 RepID=A0A8K0R7C1_9PLEO|nr:heterokaryon incompatibility protein-domain-containing protein [Paraphoma chrysanthemicola]